MFTKGWGVVSLAMLGFLMPPATLALRAFGPDPLFDAGSSRRGGTRTQRHTGAGGAGMHRAWKKRRASGRH